MKRLAIVLATVCGIETSVFAATCIVSGSTVRPLSATTAAASGSLTGTLQTVVKTSSFGILSGRLGLPLGMRIFLR